MLPYYTFVATLILVTLIPVSVTFSFQIIEAHVCGKLSLKWQGGRKPYSFLVMPIHNAPDESKPDRVLISQQIDTVYTNNYTMQNFPYSRDAQFVVIMSDADGFGTGGVSTLQSPTEGNGPGCFHSGSLAYTFTATPKKNWKTCETVSLKANNRTSSMPYEYWSIVDNAMPELIKRTSDNNEVVNWTVNHPAQKRQMILSISQDSGQYSSGGSSDLQIIGEGDTSDCVHEPTPSPTDTGSSSSSESSGSDSGSSGISGGGIAGAVVGSLAGGAAIATIAAFFLIKNKNKNNFNHENAQKIGHENDGGDVDQIDVTPYVYSSPHSRYSSAHIQTPTEVQGLTSEENFHQSSLSNHNNTPSIGAVGGIMGDSTTSYKSQIQQQQIQNKPYDQPRYHHDAGPYMVHNVNDDINLMDVPPAYNPDYESYHSNEHQHQQR